MKTETGPVGQVTPVAKGGTPPRLKHEMRNLATSYNPIALSFVERNQELQNQSVPPGRDDTSNREVQSDDDPPMSEHEVANYAMQWAQKVHRRRPFWLVREMGVIYS